MAKSILQDKKEGTCFLCIVLHGDYGSKRTQEHHVIFGRGRRQQSEKYGLKVYLCLEHHLDGKEAVHQNKEVSEILQEAAQITFEKKYPSLSFREIFGKSYLKTQRKERETETAFGFIKIETGLDRLDW